MRHRAILVACILWIAAAGCATTSGQGGGAGAAGQGGQPVPQAELQAKYPPGQFLVAAVASPVSLDDARARAKAAVAAQIRSQIRSSAQTVIEKVAVTGAASVSGRSLQSIVENADFSHAEQIRFDEALTGGAGGGWRAVAFLHGPSVVPILAQEYEQAAAQFRPASQGAMADPTLAGFAAAYRAGKAQMMVMSAKAAEMQAIARAPYPPFDNDSGWWRAVLARRAELVSRFSVCLQLMTELDAGTAARLSQMMTGAMAQLGIAATAGGACYGGATLTVDARVLCKHGHLGPVCQLEMSGVLLDGPTASKLAEVPFGDSFRGAHGNDAEKAKKKALEAVTPDKVKAALERAFSGVLPVE